MAENENWEIRNIVRKMAQDEFITDMKKDKFINEIESGLGEMIKNEPNKIQKKPSFWSKFKKLW